LDLQVQGYGINCLKTFEKYELSGSEITVCGQVFVIFVVKLYESTGLSLEPVAP
jgi:hypothetical protein